MSKQWPEGELAKRLAEAPPPQWSARQYAHVCAILADGGSYKRAAQEAGLSKNSIIGVAHRRGFPKRDSVIIVGGQAARHAAARAEAAKARAEAREEAARQAAADREAARLAREARARELREARHQDEAPPRAVASPAFVFAPPAPRFRAAEAVTKRGGRTCQWPEGDPRADDFRFCDAPDVVVGKSCCVHHCSIAYTRTAEEVDRAAEVARQVVGTPNHRNFTLVRAA